ncbi:TlpA disulfide reductase family protein [uncultured Spirosoma sp.]|uniref:TlpA family protein disulfide reductase n=1 Tax=uncultured Spirosoma sp. TaxID=278208 RepID=UPI0025878DBB|nr:TlpA disulfide reductase family protein [uncultured Spirosoma sp.]
MHRNSLIVLLSKLLLNHAVQAQTTYGARYVDETGKQYTQVQFDSLARVVRGEPDKDVYVGKAIKSGEPVPFFVLTVKKPEIINHAWLRRPFPTFTLRDTSGIVYDNNTINGKVVVLNLWSTTCHPCIDEMPLLNALVDRYTKMGVLFLAPAPETTTAINAILTKHPFTYTVLPQAQTIFKVLDVAGYPYHIVIDRNGLVQYLESGTTNKTGKKLAETDLPLAIEQALKQK